MTEFITQLAQTYLQGNSFTPDDKQLKELSSWVKKLYKKTLEDNNIRIIFVDEVDYNNPKDLWNDYRKGVLRVTTLHNDNPVLDKETNLLYRAVHGVHHGQFAYSFSFADEWKAGLHLMGQGDSFLLKQIIFSEQILQAASYFYLGKFPEQKVVLVNNYKQFSKTPIEKIEQISKVYEKTY